MLLRSPLSSSPPFFSSPSTNSRSLWLYPLRHSISRAKEEKRESVPMVCASVSQVHSYGTVDFEKKPFLHWSSLYRRVLSAERDLKTASGVLERWDAMERRLSKWELCRIAKELRKFRHFKLALEVYEWMVAQGDRFTMKSADVAVQLDLIGKVRGPLIAEQHFSNLSNSLKDKRTYCSILNMYVQCKLKEKAEATFNFMRENGYVETLSYNVMMTLYLHNGNYDIVVKLIQEMKERNIKFDIYSYNIWISNAAAMEDLDKMEGVLQIMQSDNVNANWTVYTTLASMYMKFSLLDKAEVYLREAEKIVTGRDRKAFQYFITLYGSIGKRDDLYRIWNWYKSSFNSPLNTGYRLMLQALLKLGDVAGAESVYEEWMRGAATLDPKNCQVLMGWYCRNGSTHKARETLEQLVQRGGKPNQIAWEMLAEGFVKENKLSEAVSCLENAVSCAIARGGNNNNKWRPEPRIAADLLEMCKKKEQRESLDRVVAILKRGGLDEIEPYQGFIQQFSVVVSSD